MDNNMKPISIVRSNTHLARKILAAHLGLRLGSIHDRGGEYLSADNKQSYAVLQAFSDTAGAATWYAIQPFYP